MEQVHCQPTHILMLHCSLDHGINSGMTYDRQNERQGMSNQERTFAECIRNGIRVKGLSIREVARRTGYSYEHCRKACRGEGHYFSESFNRATCGVLDLDDSAMWKLVMKEKLTAKVGPIPDAEFGEQSHRITAIWAGLCLRDRERLTAIAAVLSEQHGL